MAILDGVGERHNHQFKAAERADCLCLILDHAASSTEASPSKSRMKMQAEFLEQLRFHLEGEECRPKLWVQILINKRDLWEKANDEKKKKFKAFFEEELAKWKSGRFTSSVDIQSHSNSNPDDVQRFMSKLVEMKAN